MSWAGLKRELGFAGAVLRGKPFSVLVQVTNRCNMRCSFCDFPANAVGAAEELSLDDFRSLSGQLSDIGRFLVSLEGGEPFARTDLVEVVRIFSERHLSDLYTNGWYVTPENARALFDAGLAQVGVSIDFPDARHDAKRVLPGAFERAVRAVELLRDAAPGAGKQVHVISVLMRENVDEVESLLKLSARLGVGHVFTLLSEQGFRRGRLKTDRMPEAPIGARLLALWKRYPHWRFFKDYLARMDAFLTGGPMPSCRAGLQSFNIDHVGNVSVCIEHIDKPVGNIRHESLTALHEKLVASRELVERCQMCWTACRAFGQSLGGGGTLGSWMTLGTRMRSY